MCIFTLHNDGQGKCTCETLHSHESKKNTSLAM